MHTVQLTEQQDSSKHHAEHSDGVHPCGAMDFLAWLHYVSFKQRLPYSPFLSCAASKT